MEQLSTIQQINQKIMFGNFTNTELSSIISAVHFARSQITKQKIRSFARGDTVKFTSNRNGMTYTGTVEKIAIKYVNVRTHVGVYKVPASMLEAV
jgi:small-conductance mechanosensitive channel